MQAEFKVELKVKWMEVKLSECELVTGHMNARIEFQSWDLLLVWIHY